MDGAEIAKGFKGRLLKELKGMDLLWKLEYSQALNWFGEYLLETRYFSKEIAAGCRKYLARKRAAEKRLKNSPAFDQALALIEGIMKDMLKSSMPNQIELVKAIVEINQETDAEGEAYRRFMLSTPAS